MHYVAVRVVGVRRRGHSDSGLRASQTARPFLAENRWTIWDCGDRRGRWRAEWPSQVFVSVGRPLVCGRIRDNGSSSIATRCPPPTSGHAGPLAYPQVPAAARARDRYNHVLFQAGILAPERSPRSCKGLGSRSTPIDLQASRCRPSARSPRSRRPNGSGWPGRGQSRARCRREHPFE
jgi:hypothetical protein